MRTRFEVVVLSALLFLTLSLSTAEADPPAYTDAELLALEMSGALLPPPDLVERIGADLAAVWRWDPYFEGIHASPQWVPGLLYVRLTEQAWQEYEAGDYHGLDSLNTYYGPVEICCPFPWSCEFILIFDEIYNPAVLGPIYEQADGVDHVAAANGLDGDDIQCDEVGRYTFRRGWGDCEAGCMHQHIWVLVVEGTLVTLVTHYGDPPPDQPAGACCLYGGACVVTGHWDCEGNWQGAATQCDPNPCFGTPVEERSWGRLKARFR